MTLDYESHRQATPWRSSKKYRALITLSDQGIVSLTTFATIWLFNRWLLPDASRFEQGLYSLIYASVWVFAREILNSLVSTPHTILVPTRKGDALRRINGSALLHHFALGALITFGLAMAALGYWFAGKTHYFWLFAAAVFATPPLLLWNFLRQWCFALRRMELAWAMDLSVSALTFAGLILLNSQGHLQASTIVLAVGFANLIPTAVVLILIRREFAPGIREAKDDARATWITARWLLGSSMVWAAGLYLYPWLITSARGESDAGVYSYCFTLAGLANPLLFAVQNWLGPHIAQAFVGRTSRDFRRYVYRSAWGFALFMSPMAILMAVLSDPLLRILQPTYASHSATVSLLALAMIPQAMSFALSRGLFSLGRASLDLAANVVPIIVFLAAGVLLVRHYGPEGAAASMLFAQLSGATFRLIAFARIARQDKPIVETDVPPQTA